MRRRMQCRVSSSKQIDSFDRFTTNTFFAFDSVFCFLFGVGARLVFDIDLRSRNSQCCRPLLRSNDKRAAVLYAYTPHLRYVVLNPFDRRPINPLVLDWTFLPSTAISLVVVLICRDPPGCDLSCPFERDLYSCAPEWTFYQLPYHIPP
jgi:hypothetical protein